MNKSRVSATRVIARLMLPWQFIKCEIFGRAWQRGGNIGAVVYYIFRGMRQELIDDEGIYLYSPLPFGPLVATGRD